MDAQPATASSDGEPGLAVRARRVAHVVLAVAFVGLVLGYVQAQTYGIIGADGYYHIKWSRLLWEGFLRGEIPEFTWLPLTILDAPRYVDHHFLFHVLQIPFTWFGDLVVGAKLSAFVYGVAAMLACYGLIVQSRVRWPLVWLVALLASSSHFMWRMANPRAMSVTIVTLVLAIWLLFAKRYRWVGVLAFALVWMYSLFPLLLVLAVAWTIGDWWESRRLDWRPVAYASIGIALGLVINPYFPENIALFIDHAWMKVAEDSTVPVGAEWYPLATWGIVTMSTVTLVSQVGGLLCVRPEHRESSARTICLLLFSMFLALLAFKSRRFMEYWPPFAVVFFAVAAAPWLDRVRVNELARTWRVAVVSAAVSVAIAMVIMLFVVLDQTLDIDQPPDNPVVYAGAARWLTENTPPSSLVFNADWDDFPMLFFHDSHNAYVSGLDPTYLLYANRENSEEYGRICAGEVQDPGRLISGRFGARFAVSAKDVEHDEFIRRARADRSMKSVFEDDHAVVFEILP